jgi:hypothetical protein
MDGSPYAAGVAAGLLVTGSLVALGHGVGVSGAIQNVAGAIGHRVIPELRYWGGSIPIGLTWQVWVLVGIFVGGLLPAAFDRRWRWRAVPMGWADRFGPSVALRWTAAFAGGVLIELASALAGGCTSGLALSGGIVLSPGAFLFMGAMFATGIPAARLAYGRRR